MPVNETPLRQRSRKRSVAWIFYAILATASLFTLPSIGPKSLLGTALFGLYSWYLFRGGRFVLWIW